MPSVPKGGYVTREIPGFPGYAVTRDGHVWSHGVGRWLSGSTGSNGKKRFALHVNGERRDTLAHRAVLLAWIGPCPEGMEGCHNDGDPSNNHVSNLRWDTHAANQVDSVRHGTHNLPKLTASHVREIKAALAAGKELQREIAARYGVHTTTIGRIKRGFCWSHVE